jgi:site-specific DNA-methyltransferase (adenine-specific)
MRNKLNKITEQEEKELDEILLTSDKENIPLDARVIPPTNTFENIDCMEMLRKCPDKHFDLAIVDPPYGIGAGKEREHNGWKDYGQKEWDNKIPDKEYFEQLFRVSKNQIIWGGNYFTDYLPAKMGWVVWDKGQRDFSLADGELAWTSFDKALRIIDYPRALANQKDKIHPTQKPVFIYRQILNRYVKAGDLILDTHVGSGSSIIACIESGFNYYGCEIDKDYYDAARKRIARAFRRYELFENEAV